ncbi:MAG: hypothetical protein Q8P72_06160 [Candidatus Roizmanbacteria bacterium]|nr:hypothetical protein [Candidatus Roizmanbacteria bacterium]
MSQTNEIKSKKKRCTTLMGDFEKEWGLNSGVNPRMKLTTYLRKNGVPSLAKVHDMLS